MNEARLYMAFRAPASLENLALFRDRVDSLLDKLQDYFDEDILTFEQADSYEQFLATKSIFYNNLTQLIELHASDGWRQDAFLMRTVLAPRMQLIKTSIIKLMQKQKSAIESANSNVTAIAETQTQQFYWLALLVICIVALIAWTISRRIKDQLAYAVEIADKIAAGNLENKIDSISNDETGQLLKALATMQIELFNKIEYEKRVANESARIKTALDNVSSAIMLINPGLDIVYANPEAGQLFGRIYA